MTLEIIYYNIGWHYVANFEHHCLRWESKFGVVMR